MPTLRLVLLSASAVLASSAAIDGPMHFTVHRPCYGSGIACGAYVLAEGDITPNSPSDLEGIMRTVNFQPTVYFNSRGGSLAAGISLGRLIRSLGLDTFIGGPYRQAKTLGGDADVLVDQAVCLSACAYAFMGGRIRELTDHGLLGVHQFRTLGGDAGEGAAQLTVAILAEYLSEMGIDRKVLDLASLTEPARITPISLTLARELSLDNTDPPKSKWELRAQTSGTLTLRTVQRQARNDASIVVVFLRQGQHVGIAATLSYHLQQNPRTAKLLDEAIGVFRAPHEFRLLTDSGELLRGTTTWSVSDANMRTGFDIPSPILEKLASLDHFTIWWDWPSALRDINPTTEFGTTGLANGAKAFLR
jgi:hypothetical protein